MRQGVLGVKVKIMLPYDASVSDHAYNAPLLKPLNEWCLLVPESPCPR